MKIGEQLKRHRDDAMLTQEELGSKAGVSGFTISRIESNQVEPRVSTIRKIASALSIRPEELTVRPKAVPSFEDLLEWSQEIETERWEERRQFFEQEDALSDDQLQKMAERLQESDIPSVLWSSEGARRKEVAHRRFIIGVFLQQRAGKASERDKETLAALTG